MAILIANLGISDLSVKIDDYYFPVGFDRSEPSLNDSDLTANEKSLWEWDERESFIKEFLFPELGLKGKFSFRELTRRLLEAYQQDEETWHSRIRPGRIWSVVKTAQEPRFEVKEAYIFVTDQSESEEKGYFSDTVYLFEILKKWFEREIPKITLKPMVIRKNLSPRKQDELLNYYYQFFDNEVNRDEIVLISIKGGTEQMQTALKIQAIASGLPKQLLIEPRLSIKKILAGEVSECRLTSYWQYISIQKYQAVKLLLESRWDFDGAREILRDWSKVLKFLIKAKVTDEEIVSQSNQTLKQVIQILELGLDYLSVDYKSAQKFILNHPGFKISSVIDSLVINHGDEHLLNLYTQCCIYWDIEQIANFLNKMSSFYEDTLSRLVILCDGEQYFQDDWYLNTGLVRQKMGENLWQEFVNAELPYNVKLRNHSFDTKPKFRLEGRFTKRNFIEKVLVPYTKIPETQWQVLIDSLKSLDFWMSQRNTLIHSGEGVSKKRMQQLLTENRKQQNSEALKACPPGKIREVMAIICRSDLGIIREEFQEKFVLKKDNFYLYSDIVNWVLKELQVESSN